MKKLPFLLLLFVLTFSLSGQGFDGEEYNGRIELQSGESISGDIFFDPATGKVVITDDTGSEFFNARTASYFEFYDFEKNSIRKFYSLLYSNNPTFFELLKETKNIVLLARENISTSRAIASLSKADNRSLSEFDNSLGEKSTSETLFLADGKGNIEPYVVINSSRLGTSANYVTPYLLSSMTKSKYTEIRKYAKENNYSLKNKEHLIELLDFYDSLSKR